jgi:hypothetical protein
MINAESVAPPAPATPRKPTKLMADLSAAIRSTAQTAREQSLSQLDADVAAVVAQIRDGAKEGEGALRRQCDEDIAGIKEWSRAEIARIKEQTEHKIEARKITLGEELAGHAAAIDARVGEVEGAATAYHADMEAYAARLAEEMDAARLATLAESMPEPPSLDAWANLETMEFDPIVAAAAVEEVADEAPAEPEAVAEPVAAGAELISDGSEVAWHGEGEGLIEASIAVDEVAEAPVAVAEAVAETVESEPVEAVAEPVGGEAVAEPVEGEPEGSHPWGEPDGAWGTAQAAKGDAEGDDVPRWAAGETPDGFPTGEGEEGGDPVDRGAIMAALEAAAEAVVAAESAAESAESAETSADVAQTAAELLKGRVDDEDYYDPEAAAALSARIGAGGIEESYADRLATLMPTGHAEGDADGEPRTTQVVVSGLVSVASIASFKRHLGRLTGVTAVAVASGPDGEFVFNVTHRPDVSFRDAVPTMPGFAARVTSSADGVVQVTARDPEAEA